MTDTGMPAVPAGWYPDPSGTPRSRYWDGAQWTEHYQDPASLSYQPLAARTAPAGTKADTPWVWAILGVTLLTSIPAYVWLATWDPSGYLSITPGYSTRATSSAALASIFTPAYLLTVLGGWIGYALTVVFAGLDVRELKRRSVPSPFHWAFAFFGPLVYIIGRTVVVRRRTGGGLAPLWAMIALWVVLITLTFVLTGVMMSRMMSSFPTSGY